MWNGQYSVQCSRFGIMGHPRMVVWGRNILLIAKENVNVEINTCNIDGKLYVNKIDIHV
jgi:hypothetical protein